MIRGSAFRLAELTHEALMFRIFSIVSYIGLMTGAGPAMAQAPVPAQATAPAAVRAHRRRPAIPTRLVMSRRKN